MEERPTREIPREWFDEDGKLKEARPITTAEVVDPEETAKERALFEAGRQHAAEQELALSALRRIRWGVEPRGSTKAKPEPKDKKRRRRKAAKASRRRNR